MSPSSPAWPSHTGEQNGSAVELLTTAPLTCAMLHEGRSCVRRSVYPTKGSGERAITSSSAPLRTLRLAGYSGRLLATRWTRFGWRSVATAPADPAKTAEIAPELPNSCGTPMLFPIRSSNRAMIGPFANTADVGHPAANLRYPR